MLHKLAAHYGDVARGGNVVFRCVVKPVGVFKIRVFHAQRLCALVHFRHESALAPRDMLRKRAGGIVSRAYHNAFYKVLCAHLLPDLKEDLRTAHGSGGFARRYHVGELEQARIYRFENEQKRHDLRNGGGRQSLVCVMLKKNFTRGGIHQHGAFRRNLLCKLRRARRQAKSGKNQHKRQKQGKKFFHKYPPNF